VLNVTITADPVPDLALEGPDPTLEWLGQLLCGLGGLSYAETAVDDAVRVDRIAVLEQIKHVAAAAQAGEIVRFARSQVAAQREAGVNYRRLGQGIAEQVGLACRVSGWHGARRLSLARDLVTELPQTLVAMSRGEVSEHTAQLIGTETSHLDAETRRRVDQQLAASGIGQMSAKQAAAEARRLAYAADPQASLARAAKARKDRRVSCRPAPDTMAWLSALLPVEQAVACLAALRKGGDTARAAGDERTRGQVEADLLVERLTGQAEADQVPLEVQLLVPLDALLDPDSAGEPALIPGHGPLPAGLVDDLIGKAGARTRWRRLFTRGDAVIGGDPTARRFTGWLASLIRLRDHQTCRQPFCSAQIRHLDHIRRWRDGGPTSYPNGWGLCERDNYVRELPGWKIRLIHAGDRGPHLVATTTPTGHTYYSRAPNPP
jgi:hypothetical protein